MHSTAQLFIASIPFIYLADCALAGLLNWLAPDPHDPEQLERARIETIRDMLASRRARFMREYRSNPTFRAFTSRHETAYSDYLFNPWRLSPDDPKPPPRQWAHLPGRRRPVLLPNFLPQRLWPKE